MSEDFRSLSPEARDRDHFEQVVKLVFFGASEAMPPKVERAVSLLRDAFYDSLDLCSTQSRWPDIRLYYYDDGYYLISAEMFESYQEQYGMTGDDFDDFQHECHKFAASYPSLDREYRDELLKTRRDYYLEFLRLWMRDNPEMVVPLDYENSVNQPYQDYVRRQCMEAEDPEGCARGEGVSYP